MEKTHYAPALLTAGHALQQHPGDHLRLRGDGVVMGIFDENTRPGKHTKNYRKSPFFMGKSTISMAIFNSYVSLPEDNENNENHENRNLPTSLSPLAIVYILVENHMMV